MYGSVDDVKRGFDPQQWDPAQDVPDVPAVTGALETWSQILDGEIGHVVLTPISPSISPNLHAIAGQVTVLRVQATVWEQAIGGEAGREQAEVCRKQARELIDRVQKGAVGDGVSRGGRSPESVGSPLADEAPAAQFTMGQKF